MVDQAVPPSASVTAPAAAGPGVVRRRRADTLGYEPSLDGLRAVAVMAVLFYHARFDWIPGGFLGVSTFFTLSGFLITSLMLEEHRTADRLDLRRFYSRRFRRLLPASWTTMLLVLVMGAFGIWSTEQLRSLRGDVPAAMAEVINWWFIAQDRTYGAQFEAPSPLEHFWSLAVEQQFYLLFPLVVVGCLAVGRRVTARRVAARRGGRRAQWPLVVVLVVLAVTSAALNAHFGADSVPRAYFGTDTRLAELVIGGLLATVGVSRLRRRPGAVRVGFAFLGLVGLGASAALWYVATVPAAWLYPWGLLVTAAASTALIVGALQPGPLRAVLTLPPVVFLGRISYGIYLLHWPVFLWLTPVRTGLAPWPLFALRFGVTLVAAVVMFRLLETPVRTGVLLRRRNAAYALMPAAALLVVVTALVTRDLPAPQSLEQAAATTTTLPPPAPTRVLVVGDETANSWATVTGTDDAPLEVSVVATAGCGLAVGGYVRLPDGTVETDPARCGAARRAWNDALLAQQPQVVVISSALRDVTDRRLDVDSPWAAPGEPGLDDFLSTEVGEAIADMSATGASVVVATAPYMSNATPPPPGPPPVSFEDPVMERLITAERRKIAEGVPPPGFAENDPARIDRWNEILRAAAAARGTGVLEVGAAMSEWPGGPFDPALRAADGVGVTEAGAAALGESFAPALAEARPAAPTADAMAEIAANAPLPAAPPPTPRRVVAPGETIDVMVVGDSVAYNIGFGLDEATGQREMDVANVGQFGCPVARGGKYRFLDDIEEFSPDCDWATFFPEFLDTYDPDVVVLSSGIWEVVDRRLPGDDRFRSLGDPVVDRYALAEFLAAIDLLGSRGATVVVLTQPHLEAGRLMGFSGLPESDPARIDRLNEIIAEAVAMRPGVATTGDLQGWLAPRPGGELDPAIRTDGIHFYDSFAPEIGAWLAPVVQGYALNGLPAPPG